MYQLSDTEIIKKLREVVERASVWNKMNDSQHRDHRYVLWFRELLFQFCEKSSDGHNADIWKDLAGKYFSALGA